MMLQFQRRYSGRFQTLDVLDHLYRARLRTFCIDGEVQQNLAPYDTELTVLDV